MELIGNGPLVVSPNNNTRHGDAADRSNGNNEVHIAMMLRQTNAKILLAIDGALTRIDKGIYGVCRDCGEPISPKRLAAVPWTRVCVTCKERRNS